MWREKHAGVRDFAAGACEVRVLALARVSNVSGDAQAYALAQSLCRRLLEQSPAAASSMSERVRRLLLAQPAGMLNEDDVARAMYVSRRTLARRLEQEVMKAL